MTVVEVRMAYKSIQFNRRMAVEELLKLGKTEREAEALCEVWHADRLRNLEHKLNTTYRP